MATSILRICRNLLRQETVGSKRDHHRIGIMKKLIAKTSIPLATLLAVASCSSEEPANTRLSGEETLEITVFALGWEPGRYAVRQR